MSRHGATLTRSVPAEPQQVTRPLPSDAALPTSPWPRRLRLPALVVVLLAGLLLFIAWYGCSGETTWRIQVRWIGLGVLACVVNALACLVWLGAAIRELRRARVWTTAALRGRDLSARPVGAAPVPGWVTGDRMRRYHRADCPLMAGKSAEPVTVDVATARGLTTCGICDA